MILTDKYGRIHDYLRLSVTDKCNLHCTYCNPSDNNRNFISKSEILSFEEIYRIVNIFTSIFEFRKIRLTGGEPFARKDIETLIELLGNLKKKNNFELLATTNAELISGKIETLMRSGIDRFNFSLDTLRSERYQQITGSKNFHSAFGTIHEAIDIAANKVKLNIVVMRGINDDELNDFVDFARLYSVHVRFIEYMPFADNSYDNQKLVSYKEMIQIIESRHSLIRQMDTFGAVAKEYLISGSKGKVSFITSVSEHFCNSCNRLRMTSDGMLKLCLFSTKDSDLNIKQLIRNGESDEAIADEIVNFIANKQFKHDDLDTLIKLKNNSMISTGG
jgi:GTP 3',8-cyclase / cyclic pyranopterin monophosphate synthase